MQLITARYPAFAVWENVAGAFSSNDRLDFSSHAQCASQVPRFQCLLREDGHTPEWCEGERADTRLATAWTPSIGENPAGSHSGASAMFVVADFAGQTCRRSII